MAPPPRDDEPAPEPVYRAVLPPSPASAAHARQAVRRLMPRGCSAERSATVELLTTELVTNAVVHTGAACELRLTVTAGGVLRVAVTDHSGDAPEVQPAGHTDTHGRGLLLVDTLAAQWGVAPVTTAGKTVWFELAL